MESEHLGWLSCVICLIFTLRCANIFAKTNANIYFALTVYAAQWGVLIVYYSLLLNKDYKSEENHLPEFLPALSGYCCAITGSMIFRDHNKSIGKNVLTREKAFAWLLLFIVLPEGLHLLKLRSLEITHEDIEIMVTFILKSVGFYSLYLAAKSSTTKSIRILIILIILIIYCIIELIYTVSWFYHKHYVHDNKIVMNNYFLYGFSIIKLLTAGIFIPTILTHCNDYKKLTTMQKITHFLHLN